MHAKKNAENGECGGHSPRLEEVQQRRHAWEAQLAHEHGRVEPRVALLRLQRLTALGVRLREGLQHCVEMAVSAGFHGG